MPEVNVWDSSLICFGRDQYHKVRCSSCYIGIKFYLFVSHGDMNDRGPTCNFRNARSAFRTRGSSVFHTSMRNKQVEFNPYIYTLSQLSIFVFLNTQKGGIQNSRRSCEVRWIGCLTSQLTIFQSYMWRRTEEVHVVGPTVGLPTP